MRSFSELKLVFKALHFDLVLISQTRNVDWFVIHRLLIDRLDWSGSNRSICQWKLFCFFFMLKKRRNWNIDRLSPLRSGLRLNRFLVTTKKCVKGYYLLWKFLFIFRWPVRQIWLHFSWKWTVTAHKQTGKQERRKNTHFFWRSAFARKIILEQKVSKTFAGIISIYELHSARLSNLFIRCEH